MPGIDISKQPKTLNIVDANVKELLHALDIRAITSVQLVSCYFNRIGYYDCRGPSLNSVCVLNPQAFDEAQQSDDYRASGRPPRPLEGIPFTVKDSFMVKDMTVAAGSPAFADLLSSEDAAIVALLRKAGAVVLGKTNMPAMADGGAQRGLYGRAESPYNLQYSTTAYASGSSNGCGTSTAASFAAFGFAGETVSSGRSPASNNALVGYSPSRGVIPNRGQWPLYPTCDVIVPHTRTMEDLFAVLNVIVADDAEAAKGIDFWRNQAFVPVPRASDVRPKSYHNLADPNALMGKRIAAPRCFIGAPSAKPFHVCVEPVQQLWKKAKATLESLGAMVIETDFPLLERYMKQDFPGQSCNVPGISNEWTSIERCQMIATAWDDFLKANDDANCPNLLSSNPHNIHPRIAPMDDPSKHTEAQNQVRYPEMFNSVRDRKHTLYNLPGVEKAANSLEDMRKQELEDWMDSNGFDLLAFPTNGDIASADADEDLESMLHALQDGIKYANGGRVLKHCGVPCITLPMGTLESQQMPVGLTFACRAYADNDMLRYAFAYEAASWARTIPGLTPPIESDHISLVPLGTGGSIVAKPLLDISSAKWVALEGGREEIRRQISVEGTVRPSDADIGTDSVQVFVDGSKLATIPVKGEQWKWETCLSRPNVVERFPTIAKVPKDHHLVVIIAYLANGRSATSMLLVD
jgi:Asp-tRNA(Asn)/Glu-tRNA(Gln) amidotransferase A subunit family amidase